MSLPVRPRLCSIEYVPAHVFQGTRTSFRVRPARPSDEDGLRRMFEAAEPEDIRLRFFLHMRRFPHAVVGPLTRTDDGCHFAFVATTEGPRPKVVANAMMVSDAENREAEFGIFVTRSEADQRLGTHLMDCLIREARGQGIGTLFGVILADNANMIDLVRRLGFRVRSDPEDAGCVRAELVLSPPPDVRAA